MSIALCSVCFQRPKHHDGNKYHDFCGKTCASKRNLPAGAPAPNLCELCHVRPKYYDKSRSSSSPYCSLTCKDLSLLQRKAAPIPKPQPQPVQVVPFSSANSCLKCGLKDQSKSFKFCNKQCSRSALSQAPCLLKVEPHHKDFKSVANQFKTAWRHKTTCPDVKAIYKVVIPSSLTSSYEAYRDRVERKRNFLSQGKAAGNERRRWHGTNRACNLGDNGQTAFCSSSTCSLCLILKTSYRMNLAGKKTGWGRFGAGIYTSSTSSKSNDYSSNLSLSPWKALILNKVVVGHGYQIKKDSPNLTSPPAGYDSVLGEVGTSLNHDELIVYDESAIRVSWLIMYA